MTTSDIDKGPDNDNHSEYFIAIEEIGSNALDIRGNFKVPYDENGITPRGAQVLKHISLVVTRSGNYQALTPFKEIAVFDDDVKEEQGSCSGFFNIKVMDHIGFDGEGDYYLLCSLGTYLSNIIKVTV